MLRTCLAEASKTSRRHAHFLRPPFVLTTLEDDRSPAEYKEEVVQGWEKLSSCCARPGLAQDMKHKGVDLRDSASRQWLLPFAVGLTMSLGNTERQHAHNKAFCTSCNDQAQWTQFVAQSVLHQAKCVMTATRKAQEAQQAEKRKVEQQALPPASSSASPLPRAVDAPLAAPPPALADSSRRPKARSPLELFKADFSAQLAAAGEHVNVATAAFWTRLRAAWSRLPSERIEMYKKVSEAEKTIARHARKVWREGDAATSTSESTQQHAVALPGPRGAQGDDSLAVVALDALLVGMSQPSPLPGDVALPGAGQPGGRPSQEPDAPPLSPQILDSYLQKSTLAKLKQSIHSTANKYQQAGEYTIPKKVNYGSQCRGLCQKSPRIQLGMQEVMWRAWSLVFDIPNKVNRDFLMVYEVYDSDTAADPVHVGFALLTACACRYGRHPARQDFLRLDVIAQPNGLKGANYEACTLRARRAPYVRPHSDIPRQFNKFLAGAQGRLDIVSEDTGC
jgi:hypothetical protein